MNQDVNSLKKAFNKKAISTKYGINNDKSKFSLIIAIGFSLLCLILFHKKRPSINPQYIRNSFFVFEIPNIIVLKIYNYIFDMKYFYKIQNSIIQSNLTLTKRITDLQNENDEMKDVKENLNIERNNFLKYNIVNVITANDNFDYLLINKGLKDGIHDNSIVLRHSAIFGIVFKTMSDTSYVVPIYSTKFKIPAKVHYSFIDNNGVEQKDTVFGIIQGGSSNIMFSFLNKDLNYSISGSEILTSGEGSLIPNLYIGTLGKNINNNYVVNAISTQLLSTNDGLLVISKTTQTQEFKEKVDEDFNSIIDSHDIFNNTSNNIQRN